MIGHVYASAHKHSRTVCEAFAAGSGLPIVATDRLREGVVVAYGRLRGLEGILVAARAARRDWIYLDRGYLGATRGDDYSGYFRATVDSYQHDGRGESDGRRFAALGLPIAPWRRDGDYVLLCPPSRRWADLEGFGVEDWMRRVVPAITAATKRPIRVREKPRQGLNTAPLSADLAGAWCVVVHASNVAVEALLAGVPIVCTGACAAASMAGSLDAIEHPYYPQDRERFFGVLADNQWTLDEMRAGEAWRVLQHGIG